MSEPAKDEAELISTLSYEIGTRTARAALAAIRAAGWAVVPVEPTEEIQAAIIDAAFGIECITEDDDAAKIYQAAMLAAAPGLQP